ncbi:protein RER1-like isoform X1 [Ostrea edulis]|uniref:protein RER1-like isoform X1 n=1 Tax=Ostrea edulis TaxID=37623 RepID=UPI0024AF0D71|nr:protein RER1-like isoform X1 [Ostrea edulis]
MADLGESPTHSPPGAVQQFFRRVGETKQNLLDKATPYTAFRWTCTIVLFLIYGLRVYLLQGWYIVTYALGIFQLNQFIAFLTPKVDPAFQEQDDDEDGPSLPTKSNEEFRPFMRRLPEFKFWYSASKAVVVAMICTFFEALNIPVFWPILVMYFIILFVITMKRQIRVRNEYIKIKYAWFAEIYNSDASLLSKVNTWEIAFIPCTQVKIGSNYSRVRDEIKRSMSEKNINSNS